MTVHAARVVQRQGMADSMRSVAQGTAVTTAAVVLLPQLIPAGHAHGHAVSAEKRAFYHSEPTAWQLRLAISVAHVMNSRSEPPYSPMCFTPSSASYMPVIMALLPDRKPLDSIIVPSANN